jgi:hypothetical protein
MKSRLFVQFLPLAVAAFAACGCNETSQPAMQQAQVVPCRCGAPVAVTTAPASEPAIRHYRHRYARHYASWHESRWSAQWSESERSSSTVEYGYGESSEREGHVEGEASAARYAYWVDAYGRRHCYDRALGHEISFRHEGSDEAARLDPWHGYDGHDGPGNGY